MEIGTNIEKRMKQLGINMSELARRLGVTPQAVRKWIKAGGNPNSSRWNQIAEALETTVEALMSGDFDDVEIDANIRASKNDRKLRPIPVICRIPAGGVKEIIDSYHAGAGMDEVFIDDSAGPDTFALIIDGTSMEPKFQTGDKVIIDPSVRPIPGDFVVFKCKKSNGDDCGTFKQYRLRGFNEHGFEYYELVPLNDNYPTIRSDKIECEIIGTMVEHRTYRRSR